MGNNQDGNIIRPAPIEMAHIQRHTPGELNDFEKRFFEERRNMTAGLKSQMSGFNVTDDGNDRPSFISNEDRADLSITMDRNDASMLYGADEGRRVTAADLIDKMNQGDNIQVIEGDNRKKVMWKIKFRTFQSW